ncbi:MAG: hypothetical protein VX278_20370 [Myxococcota bacterium]|nr:hypothetical protein [Myxococcota bacterium]
MNRALFLPIRNLIRDGETAKALERLSDDKYKSDPLRDLFIAVCSEHDQLSLWEKAVQELSKEAPSEELLFALERASFFSKEGKDQVRLRQYLKRASDLSDRLGKSERFLEYQSIYANRLLCDGYLEKAQEILHDIIVLAQEQNHSLLLISQGVVLSSLLMNQQKWVAAASLSIIIEEAARDRENWIALACAVMMRASCWHAQKRSQLSVQLLLRCGRELYEQGAVSALNLIKARLAELKTLIGDARFNEYCRVET